MRRTTILGKSYPGRPGMNSLACRIWLLQRKGRHRKARELYEAHCKIARAFGAPEPDLAKDMTTLPDEGGFAIEARPIDRIVLRVAA